METRNGIRQAPRPKVTNPKQVLELRVMRVSGLTGELTMNRLRMLFLGLAIWGSIHPMYYFISWFNANGYDLMAMVDAWHANEASSGLVWDLTIAAVALTIWVIVECIQTKRYIGFLAIPATFCIGVSCGLPLYLFLRSQPSA